MEPPTNSLRVISRKCLNGDVAKPRRNALALSAVNSETPPKATRKTPKSNTIPNVLK